MNDKGALVYVVDDDSSARDGVARLIRSAGLGTKTFASAEEFLASLRPKSSGCLVLDVNLPGLSGLELQQELVKAGHHVPIIFLTGHGDIASTVRAVKAGAVNFLTKPVGDEDLLNAIRQCITSDLEQDIQRDRDFGNIIGESSALQDVLRDVQVVAPTDATVLIKGETGTGKELMARAIHNLSSRSKRPFIAVNCAALAGTLLESELFGHEKGAFTNAFTQKIGRFELAHQGTIFLDEIGEIPLDLQPKLLRVLQEREFERVGGTRTIQTNARVIAASNRDLKSMVETNNFRSDLYYRLDVFPIRVPALRERAEDIALLICHFVQEFSRRTGRAITSIPSQTMEALVRYHWPGNIRELQNVIERAVIVSKCGVLTVDVSELNIDDGAKYTQHDRGSLDDMLHDTERTQILRALEQASGVVSGPNGAAARLSIKRTTLLNRMQRLGIRISRNYTASNYGETSWVAACGAR